MPYNDEELVLKYTCAWCGEPIYIGDEYYEISGDQVCTDCMDDCKKKAKRY